MRCLSRFCRLHAARKFGVNGFRPGAPAAIPKVISRVLDAARSHAASNSTPWPNIWPLYERAALAYIDHDRLALSRLLRKERLQAGEGSKTAKILRSIVKYLPLYDVPIEHVRELYELWGFERTDLIEGILSDRAVRADTGDRAGTKPVVRRRARAGTGGRPGECPKRRAHRDARRRWFRRRCARLFRRIEAGERIL
jgi:hypothetical protein